MAVKVVPAGSKQATAPAKEDKGATFRRLATQRTNRVLDALRVLGKLSGGQYPYTDDQVRAIMDAIRERVNKLDAAFKAKQADTSDAFSL